MFAPDRGGQYGKGRGTTGAPDNTLHGDIVRGAAEEDPPLLRV